MNEPTVAKNAQVEGSHPVIPDNSNDRLHGLLNRDYACSWCNRYSQMHLSDVQEFKQAIEKQIQLAGLDILHRMAFSSVRSIEKLEAELQAELEVLEKEEYIGKETTK